MEPGRWPQWRPLKRHDSHVAEQMVERAAELARDSHARTRHAAVLIKDDSMLGWGTNGVPFPGEDHCYCKFGESGHHDMCRTHAEQRAITLAREGDGWRMLPGSKLIYVRLEADDSVRLEKPHFCPRCSRLALSLGVAEWIFALSEGLAGYSAPTMTPPPSSAGYPRLRTAAHPAYRNRPRPSSLIFQPPQAQPPLGAAAVPTASSGAQNDLICAGAHTSPRRPLLHDDSALRGCMLMSRNLTSCMLTTTT